MIYFLKSLNRKLLMGNFDLVYDKKNGISYIEQKNTGSN